MKAEDLDNIDRGMIHDYSITFRNAQEELLWRLNEWWHGRHPGKPINWKGLDR